MLQQRNRGRYVRKILQDQWTELISVIGHWFRSSCWPVTVLWRSVRTHPIVPSHHTLEAVQIFVSESAVQRCEARDAADVGMWQLQPKAPAVSEPR